MVKRKEVLLVDERVNFGSGRLEEKRRSYGASCLELLDELADWPKLKSVVMVEHSRGKNGITVNSLSESVLLKGKEYAQLMPDFHFLMNKDPAKLLTYLRIEFKAGAGPVSTGEIAKKNERCEIVI